MMKFNYDVHAVCEYCCWVLRHNEIWIGYITLFADKLIVQSELLDSEKVRYRTFPIVKMG